MNLACRTAPPSSLAGSGYCAGPVPCQAPPPQVLLCQPGAQVERACWGFLSKWGQGAGGRRHCFLKRTDSSTLTWQVLGQTTMHGLELASQCAWAPSLGQAPSVVSLCA